ncbi:MAG: glutamine synthetase [Eubacteriales bacterium]|nr:glutamine synthetase [Clostridiales bacterium]MDD7308782.1 glutamine synthetase [Eubacteriales bacterium]MDY2933557.1 hypothetical protein [Anaerovoracaceae bacterium]
MLDFDFDKMLFTIGPEDHSADRIKTILNEHPEVQFVSLVGIDIGGHGTDEKIPVRAFIKDIDKFLTEGVQTDGSSVVLPKIADLNNAKVDIIPDLDVNWYVDYNFDHVPQSIGLPVGSLRIPSYLRHNDTFEVGSRVVLRDAVADFKKELMELLKANPYVFEYMDLDSADEIEELIVTSATELEFWVKTPDEQSDREQLTTAQELKEQYWKRTVGPVRTALERTLNILDRYGLEMEMGHKEVGGVKAKMGHSGHYDHIMEQLEVDWKYSDALQAADNEKQVKYIVRDIFRLHGLDVTFMAKPMEGVAGSGEHTHLGLAAKLKDGRVVSMFSSKDGKDFLNVIGYGALMGILNNYEVINPFISATNDAFNRLKPGFEAPVCTVTSMGHSVEAPSRNRTVLAGLIREAGNPLATRFELRSPNPNSNTYLVIAASYMAMLDGIRAAVTAGKTPAELEKSISKKKGEEDFYLETGREYRSEKDVFAHYTPEERDDIFGRPPETVWENISAFDKYPDKLEIFKSGGVMTDIVLESYREAIVNQWATELYNRIIPNAMDTVRSCRKLHNESATDYDIGMWAKISAQRDKIAKNTMNKFCILKKISDALDKADYNLASRLQLEAQREIRKLIDMYSSYKRNLL